MLLGQLAVVVASSILGEESHALDNLSGAGEGEREGGDLVILSADNQPRH